jgi:hypothetical protein
LHALTDATSPAQEGFQLWYGLNIVTHKLRERSISPEQFNDAVRAAQEAYSQTFGAGFNEFDSLELLNGMPLQGNVTVRLLF